MGLVSLGACSFTISSIMAFKSSTMGWDASRVTAALPSGVGFLGGALIWKGSIFINDEEIHQVNGLTTAASVWLSAAVGVGCGGALYLVTTYVVILVVMILRYAPRSYLKGLMDTSEEMENEEEQHVTKDCLKAVSKDQVQSSDSFIDLKGDFPQDATENDLHEGEVIDMVSSMRVSYRGLGECEVPIKLSSSKRTLSSRSTGSLRGSVRAQVPTFGD
jgi:putative Mg2+ transporter-C (MgtC) family protein